VTANFLHLRWLRAANSPDSGLEPDMKIGGCGCWIGRGQIEIERYW